MTESKLTDEEVEQLEKLMVKLHSEKRTDLYTIRSKWDPEGYAISQRKQKIPEGIRWRVWKRDNYTCAYCLATDAVMTLDHVFPEDQGGTYDAENLVTSCGKCNNKKASKSVKEFVESEWLIKKRERNHQHLLTTGQDLLDQVLAGISEATRIIGKSA